MGSAGMQLHDKHDTLDCPNPLDSSACMYKTVQPPCNKMGNMFLCQFKMLSCTHCNRTRLPDLCALTSTSLQALGSNYPAMLLRVGLM